MVGHGRVSVAAINAGLGQRLDGGRAVAPLGVHLQVAAVALDGRSIDAVIGKHAPHFGPAQKVPPQVAASQDIGAPLAVFNRLLDRRGRACLQDLANHACRTRADARNPR
jgi:hypothetical protein